MSLVDGAQRQQATHPGESFIVQAPAGSGKTEMLSQRFLRLLGVVDAPEQIVALTFTRKAAAEMRERIIKALIDATRGTKADSPHQQETLMYAQAAMQRSEDQQWRLLEQPWRLRIMTIDSLCQQLCQAIPIQENAVAFGDVTEDSQKLYEQATRSCIENLKTDRQHGLMLATLLAHLDNRMDRLIKLCCDMLARREQWLPMVFEARRRSREELEQALASLVEHEIERFIRMVPYDLQNQLMSLTQRVAAVSNYQKQDLSCLLDWQKFDAITAEQLVALTHILLNTSGELRGQYDHHIGVKKSALNDAAYQSLKSESGVLQANLKTIPGFCDQLVRLRGLPTPYYSDAQWKILSCLLDLLLQLAVHLQYSFQQSRLVDFTAIAKQAVTALGDEEDPTDLALYLDNRIHHLLVDEFQDTSQNQYALLCKLVMGWQPDDGRSLFLVGDPMQSIYRFRQAEVGLFIKAREEGLGPVGLTPLELQANFRSSANIVDWVNRYFRSIFPTFDDIEAGAIRYHPSVAIHKDCEDSFIKSLQLQNSTQEAQYIIEIIQQEQQRDPEQSIAVLVRSRTHLHDIMQRLREAQIPFQGVDIDPLATLPHIQDVWSLTQILLYPANRLAWFSLLRSPFCGMALSDLHALAVRFPQTPFLEIAGNPSELPAILSPEGWQRFQFFTSILLRALQQRHQQKLTNQLACILQSLGANSLYDARQFAELEQYWLLLDKFESEGLLRDQSAFTERLKLLYSQASSPAKLQIMTIHKAKGLEFDTVIIPHLGAKKRNPTPDLIRWLTLPQRQQQSLFLLAPLKAASQETCILYDFLQSINDEKEAYEQQRLLYVAITRAKQRLYLTDHHTGNDKNSMRNLLLEVDFTEAGDENNVPEDYTASLPRIERFPLERLSGLPSFVEDNPANRPITHQSSENPAAILGTWAHQLLQWINEQQIFELSRLPWHWLETELRSLGWDNSQCDNAREQIKTWLAAMLNDSQGQWILQKREFSHNEIRILEKSAEQLHIKQPDRLFRDENQHLWIVDFKTGRADSRNQTKHRQQVDDYARLLQQLYQEPVFCGIYYLEQTHWVQWSFQPGDF